MKKLAALVVFMISISSVNALVPGKYGDYMMLNDYIAPERPEGRLALSRCEELLNKTDCGIITKANISDYHKKLIIAKMFFGDDGENKLYNVSGWNEGIETGSYPPDGVRVHNGSIIQNAWISLIPSAAIIDEKNRTWVENRTEVRIDHNLEMVVQDIDSSIPGFCGADYSITGYDYSIDTSIDGQNSASGGGNIQLNIPKSHGETAEINSVLSFTAEWNASISKLVNETVCQTYQSCHQSDNVTVCDSYQQCWLQETCRYSHTEHFTEQGSVNDSVTVHIYDDAAPLIRTVVDSFENNISSGWIVGLFPKSTNAKIRIGSGTFSAITTAYSVRPALEPYDFLEATALSEVPLHSSSGVELLEGGTYASGIPQTKHPLPGEFLAMNGSDRVFFLYRYAARNDLQSCRAEVESYFSKWITTADCRYDSSRNSSLSIDSTNLTEMEMEIRIRLSDGKGNPVPDRLVLIEHFGSGTELMTDYNGEIALVMNRTSGYQSISAHFDSDLNLTGAKAEYLIEPYEQNPFDVDVVPYLVVGSIYYGVYWTYKRMAGLVRL